MLEKVSPKAKSKNQDVIVLKNQIHLVQEKICSVTCPEFSDVTFASDDDNDNSDLIECDQQFDKTPIEDVAVIEKTQRCSTTRC